MALNENKTADGEVVDPVQRLNSLNNLGQALTASLDLDKVLAQVLAEVSLLLNAEGVAVLLLEEDELIFRAVSGQGASRLEGFRMPANRGIAGEVVATREPKRVYGEDGRKQQYQEAEKASQYQTQDLLAVPLILDGKVVGVLEAAHSHSQRFSHNDLKTLQDIATWVNVAIRNAQLYQSAQQEILERRFAEEALRESERKLEKRVAERTQELEDAYQLLQQQDALKTKFIDDISHEMRTPVTNLSLYLDLVDKRKDDPQKLDYYLSVIKIQNKRLAELIDQFINFSRLERDFNELPSEWVNLNEITQKCFDAYQDLASAAGIKFCHQLDTSIPLVWGVKEQLKSAIQNLILNAIRYTPEGGVRLSSYLHEEKGWAVLEISDTGIGISPSEMPYVRERFYRSPRVSQLTVPGAGLGLALAEEIINQHKGKLDIVSQEKVGTTVTLHLPLNIEEDQEI